jgi:hypothetical protein
MAHNLSTVIVNGQRKVAFLYNSRTVGVPWHELGDSHDGEFNIVEGARMIGADFMASGDAVFREDGSRIEGWQEIRHPDGMSYGIRTQDYEIVQYLDLAEALATAAGRDGGGGNTMGMLGEDCGEFFCSFESQFAKIDKKNEIKRFVVFLTGHNGKGNRFFGTDINPVCQNTVNAGLRLAENTSGFVMLPHKRGVTERIKAMAAMIAMTQAIQKDTLEAYVALAERVVDSDDVENFTRDLFPFEQVEANKGKEIPDTVTNKRIWVEQAFAHPKVAGKPTGSDGRSAYGLLNAATWWVDHHQAKENWSRTQFSPAAQETRQRAFDLALEFVRN